MLQRKTKAGLIVITQPAHSWLSGQLSRAWGNDRFGAVKPAEEVALAAALHDVGFLSWEESPTLNVKTGSPYTFMEMPTAEHLQVWTQGIEQMMLLNRYAALLTSLHYSGLAERHPVTGSPKEAELQARFLQEQQKLQTTLLTELSKESHYASYTTDEVIHRNRRLIAIWDWMSLVLGFDRGESVRIEEVPAHFRSLTLQLDWLGKPSRVRVSPWPFQTASLELFIEGRLIESKFNDEAEMQRQIQNAPVKTLPIVLTPE